MRRAVEFAIGAVCLAVLVRAFLVLGWVEPVRVTGSSMAPTLRGAHIDVACPACAAVFTAAIETRLGHGHACPQCGEGALVASGAPLPGDRLVVDRLASLDRWDMVVFHEPPHASRLAVKRVLGLPGERVTIDEGDLWVEGVRLTKSLADQLRVRIPMSAAQADWRADCVAWRPQGGDWLFAPIAERPSAELSYQPPGGEVNDDLTDNLAVSRRLERVDDRMLCFTLHATEGAQVQIAFGGAASFAVQFDAANGCVRLLDAQGEPLGEAPLPPGERLPIVCSSFDRQALVAVGDEALLRAALAPPGGNGQFAHPAGQRLAVSAWGGTVELGNLKVHRDIYYQGAPAGAASVAEPASWRLGPDELFVVGDNQAVSLDSRSWASGPGLPRRLVIGRAAKPSR
ncbi:signal peptidase I [Pseudobythopirellula maris]|uniref:Signal peptidase I n=1 Tax=Pseudobythopirellula maris TaxID=2527991 RepID=A0A5C5ZN68_9BACT|nr:S26 family signal peptidase [Pseudobythopirellula maris]TWT88515.1 signal peptidase I [Pseudobythopirellula maris]